MWQFDCALSTAKAFLPFEQRLRAIKRRIAPPSIGPQHESVLSGGFDHVAALRSAGLEMQGAHVLEIGTGWFPIIPLMLRAAGVERVYLADAHRLMDIGTLRAAQAYVRSNERRIADRLEIDPARVRSVTDAGRDSGDLETELARLGFVYLAPFEAARSPQVDAVISQTVFEHISPAELKTLMLELKPGLKSDGLMSHGIDNTDHRRIKDHRVDSFDFLRYSDSVWRLLCLNPQDYTNRLRHSDYVELFQRAGYTIVAEKTYVDHSSAENVAAMQLGPRFSAKTIDDLVTGWSHFVVRQASDPRAA